MKSPMLEYALSLTTHRIRNLTSDYTITDAGAVKIQSGFIAWVADYGYSFTVPYFAWTEFWKHVDRNLLMSAQVQVMNAEDHACYIDLWNERYAGKSLANITQVMDIETEQYMGAWMTGYNKETLTPYWLWTDSAWSIAEATRFEDVLAMVRTVVKHKPFMFLTYGNLGKHVPLVSSGRME